MLARFFTDPVNTPFLVALVVLVALSIIVVASSLLGAFSHIGADFDHGGGVDVDTDIDIDSDAGNGFGLNTHHIFDFLGVSTVPISILVIVGATTFFLTGYITQWIAFATTSKFLNGLIATIPATVFMVAAMNATSRLFKKYQIREHTTAVHGDTFVGKTAVVTGGVARRGLPSQGKLTDSYGQTHYLLVEPVQESEQYAEGTEVLLLKRSGSKYYGVLASQSLDDLNLEDLTQKLDQMQ